MSSAPANLTDEVRGFLADLRSACPAAPTDLSIESSVDLCRTELVSVQDRLDALKSNAEQTHDIQVQLEEHSSNLNKQLAGYLADIELILHRAEGSGQAFFDETLQLRGVIDLLNQTVIAEGYFTFVLADTKHEVDRHVDEIVDWLVSSELAQWKMLRAQVADNGSALSKVIAEQLDARFDYDRSRLSTSLGRTLSDSMALFDAEGESKAVAESIRNAATNVLFLGVAALVMLVAATSAEALTGDVPPLSIAAGLAAAAVAVIPWARRRAKTQLQRRVGVLRMHLQKDLRYRAEKEIEASKKKIMEIVAAPITAINAEQSELAAHRVALDALEQRAVALQSRVASDEPKGTL